MTSIRSLAEIGAIEGGGVNRLALTETDRQGRDQVMQWMRELGLTISIDAIGNVVGTRAGTEQCPPVMTGSHIDTVRAGGRYDGSLGVLAGLEAIRRLNELGIKTRTPISVAFFTNEEGARFAPDMMGSMVYQGHFDLDEMLEIRDFDGTTVGDALEAIGYAGTEPCPASPPAAYVELHIEQGPVLEQADVTIGAVTGVQGISWTEWTFDGQSNHAGTTPMHLRHDAGHAAGEMVSFIRRLVGEIGGTQVGTVGAIKLQPNIINVIARQATLAVDLRNTDEQMLQHAESELRASAHAIAKQEGLELTQRQLARFRPIEFSPAIVSAVEMTAGDLGHTVMSLPSGAGHDAQAFAPKCPTGMIFIPSAGGISHNINEYTAPSDIKAGADILLRLLVDLAGTDGCPVV